MDGILFAIDPSLWITASYIYVIKENARYLLWVGGVGKDKHLIKKLPKQPELLMFALFDYFSTDEESKKNYLIISQL